MGKKRGNWEQLSSKLIHQNPFYSVREDVVIKPDGAKGTYNVVELKDSVFIVALDKEQNVYLVELHRYTNDKLSVELPAGGSEGRDILVAAKRELQEETGLKAKTWKRLGYIHPANGIVSSKDHVFLATDLEQTTSNSQEEEGISRVLRVPLKKAMMMVKNGEITDSESIASLTLAALEVGLLDK